jgi:glutamine amidotransferase
MMPQVTVVDYGVGNLYSVARALECVGAVVSVVETAAAIRDARLLILPGVGSFQHGMGELRRRGLVEAIVAYGASGRPFLGICLGMQLMFEASEEFGEHEGLGMMAGRVAPVPGAGSDGTAHKIPHIGWNALLRAPAAQGWDGTVLAGIREGAAAYFVHSYGVLPADPRHRLADCSYDGCVISAAVHTGMKYGCQFHPERSGRVGLKVLENFVRLD